MYFNTKTDLLKWMRCNNASSYFIVFHCFGYLGCLQAAHQVQVVEDSIPGIEGTGDTVGTHCGVATRRDSGTDIVRLVA